MNREMSAAVKQACHGFEKVIDALDAFIKVPFGDLKRYPTTDLLSSIRRPDGKGILIIGRRGERGFDLAAGALFEFDSELHARVSKRELIPILKELFSRNVLGRWERIDEELTERLLRAAGRYVRLRLLKTSTHVLPCILGPANGPQLFAVGAVTFRPTAHFLDEQRKALDEYRHGSIVRDLRECFSSYPWVGLVEICRCSPAIAEERARLAMETALNALRLGLGDRARYLRLGGLFKLEQLTVTMQILGKTGEPSFTWMRRPNSSPWEAEWISVLNDQLGDILKLVGDLIEPIRRGYTLPELHQRTVDALAWYGEAIAERQPHTKIVRCMLALERLLVTPGKGRSEHKATTRGARLCSAGEPHRLAHWETQFQRLYDLRDEVFHGSLSPFDYRVSVGAALAELVAGRCLETGLHWYAHLSRRNPRMSEGEITGQYETGLAAWLENIKPRTDARNAEPADDESA